MLSSAQTMLRQRKTNPRDPEKGSNHKILRRLQMYGHNIPPSISLNIHGGNTASELIIIAIFGIVLQIGALVFCGFVTFHPLLQAQFKPQGDRLTGFILVAAGNILLVASMVICSWVVDKSTVETTLKPGAAEVANHMNSGPVDDGTNSLFWVQKAHVAGDQNFKSFLIKVDDGNSRCRESGILMSQRASEEERNKLHGVVAVAVFLGVVGFICQFQGLRFSNWTCSIAQLAAVIIMTCLRALLRRNLRKQPFGVEMPEGFELDYLSLYLALENRLPNKADSTPGTRIPAWFPTNTTMKEGREMKAPGGGFFQSPQGGGTSKATASSSGAEDLIQHTVLVRQRLGEMTGWKGPMVDQASQLALWIETTMSCFEEQSKARLAESCQKSDPKFNFSDEFRWAVPVSYKKRTQAGLSEGNMWLTIRRTGSQWRANISEIDAVLSLSEYHRQQQQQESASGLLGERARKRGVGDWVRGLQEPRSLVLVGRNFAPSSVGSNGSGVREPRLESLWWLHDDDVHVRLSDKTSTDSRPLYGFCRHDADPGEFNDPFCFKPTR